MRSLIGKEEKPAPAPVAELEPAAEDDLKAMKIREFLEGLMEHLNVQATPDIYRSETGYKVILQGHGLGAIIGRRGRDSGRHPAADQLCGEPQRQRPGAGAAGRGELPGKAGAESSASGPEGGRQGHQVPPQRDTGTYECL